MKTIDKALSEYTDLLISGQNPNTADFQKDLATNDYEEFCSLCDFSCLFLTCNEAKKDLALVDKLNNQVSELFPINVASNFRTTANNTASISAQRRLDDIFNKEFGDDHE